MQWVTMCFRKDIRDTTGTLEDNLEVSEKMKHACSCKLAILLVVVYPNRIENYVHPKTCTSMFIAVVGYIIERQSE